MAYFESEKSYIMSCKTTQDRIVAIDAIIDALLLTSATASLQDGVSEYWLNDGQTQIKKIYRSTKQVTSAIEAFEALKQTYLSRIHGRVIRLVDSKNFPHNGRYY